MRIPETQIQSKALPLIYSKLADYVMLVKFRLSLVVVFSSVTGYLIASGTAVDWVIFSLLAIGGFLVTSSANALNQVLEREYDVFMARTADRPLATGRMKTSEAVLFAGLTCLTGIGVLALINPLTATLGMLSLIIYAFIYTPLKRYSTLAVAIGAVPGALPVMIGFTAFDGRITFLAFALFVVQFLWQFPHFWSIGFLSFGEYKKAGFKLLPEIDGEIDRSIGRVSAFYSLLILPVLTVLYSLELVSGIATLIGVLLTLIYFLLCVNLDRKFTRKAALMLMLFSFIYLPLVLIAYWLI